MPSRQRAHLGHAVGDLVAEQHPAAARLRALADDDLDRVGAAQVVGVHAVARGQELVDERCREWPRSSGVMPPSPVVVDVPTSLAPRPSASFAGAESAPKLMPAIVIGIFSSSGFFACRVPEHDVGVAALAVALERVARHARAQEQQVVEVGEAALRAEAADVVDALARGALDLGDDVAVVEVRLAQPRVPARPGGVQPASVAFRSTSSVRPALSTLKV